VLQDSRQWFHERRIEETLNANGHLCRKKCAMGGVARAVPQLEGQVSMQALVMTFNDIFFVMGAIALVVLPLVLFLRPFSNDAAPDAPMH
jgi:DHA2 family multidrug resistance protein